MNQSFRLQPNADLAERKAAFLSAITRWVRERNVAECLSREQYAKLEGMHRLVAQRQALLDNMAQFYAMNSNADAAPGVLALVTALSDNAEGCCTLSVERMAKFLSRSPRRISDAISRLARDGCLYVTKIPGAPSKLSPIVHRDFADNNSLAWLVDARAPTVARQKPGRPTSKKTPDTNVCPIWGEPLTPVAITPDAGDEIPLTLVSPNTTNKNTTNKTAGVGAPKRYDFLEGNFSADEIATSDEAVRLWNETADEIGLQPVKAVTAQRRQRVLDRLEEIGGISRYRMALAAIKLFPFFCGKEAPRKGMREPFRLDFDRLLQDDGSLGDVLARLIDKAASQGSTAQPAGPFWKDPAKVAAITHERWREMIAEHAIDVWVVSQLGPPPGRPTCVVPKQIVAELRLCERFDQNGLRRDGWTSAPVTAPLEGWETRGGDM